MRPVKEPLTQGWFGKLQEQMSQVCREEKKQAEAGVGGKEERGSCTLEYLTPELL